MDCPPAGRSAPPARPPPCGPLFSPPLSRKLRKFRKFRTVRRCQQRSRPRQKASVAGRGSKFRKIRKFENSIFVSSMPRLLVRSIPPQQDRGTGPSPVASAGTCSSPRSPAAYGRRFVAVRSPAAYVGRKAAGGGVLGGTGDRQLARLAGPGACTLSRRTGHAET